MPPYCHYISFGHCVKNHQFNKSTLEFFETIQKFQHYYFCLLGKTLAISVLITNIGISMILFCLVFTYFLQKEVTVVFFNVNFGSRKVFGGELGHNHINLIFPSYYVSCPFLSSLKNQNLGAGEVVQRQRALGALTEYSGF